MSDTTEKVGDFVEIARSDNLARVTLDRGDPLNRLSLQAMRELKRVAEVLREDASVDAVVLTGASNFSAGADLTDPEMAAREAMTMVEHRNALRLGPEMCEAWASMQAITIAAIVVPYLYSELRAKND